MPLYSVTNGNSTSLTISNTGRRASAIKVLFLDQAGAAVTGLNLYLSGQDTWVMSLSSDGQGTRVKVPDSSCTAPYLFETGTASSTLNLPAVGQILITEMAALSGLPQANVAILDDTLLPRDCGYINDNWAPEGLWSGDPAKDVLPPEEQIRAEVQIINVQEGTAVSVPGLVLSDFSDTSLHTAPTELLPDLSSANSSDSAFENGAKSFVVSTGGELAEDDWADPVDAVSVILATHTLSSGYTAEDSIGAKAEWVLSFPTLKYYTGGQGSKDYSAATIDYQSNDRNGKLAFFCQPPIVLSPPCPPDGEFVLEDYLLAIGSASESQFGLTAFHGSDDRSHDIASAGRLDIDLIQNDDLEFHSQSGNVYAGLPVFAFGIQKYRNGYLAGPNGERVLANYWTRLDIDAGKFYQNVNAPWPREDWGYDILSTALDVDISAQTATAGIVLKASSSLGASFEIGDLEIIAVRSETGPLNFEAANGQLNVGLPASNADRRIEIDYGYSLHENLDGAMSSGVTMIWPYYCGNLFPCKSSPSDGLTFELSLSNVSADQVAIYPRSIDTDAPSYQIAWAIGDYTYKYLGTTQDGTRVGVWYLPGSQANAIEGTASLAAHFNWFETTYGRYTFGNDVASVEAPWGTGATGGMEHHPFWHVASASMSSQLIQTHEAAHGWFGGGVRIACWEDFVLSEGTSTYLTGRAVEAVDGQTAGEEAWAIYGSLLLEAQQSAVHKIAWPEGCGAIDILDYVSNIPYMKGAYFLRAVEHRIGRSTLDEALAKFYQQYVGHAATMNELIRTIVDVSGYSLEYCVDDWLRSEELPADIDAACR